ncbi:hypothetical protein J3F83DRAFT_453065 [Trichoderma novae-zelandiae]
MAKRKCGDPLPPPKRARLTQPHDTIDSESSLTKRTRREKRKRTERLPSDPYEEPETKRARTSTGSSDTTDSPSISREPWPSIEDVSEEEWNPARTNEKTTASRDSSSDLWPFIAYEPKPSEEIDPAVLAFQIAGATAMAGYVCECEYHHKLLQNSMPSPEPSDGDAGEREEIGHTIVDERIPRARHSALKPQPILSPELPKASPRRNRSVTPHWRTGKRGPVPSRQEEAQQQRNKNKTNKKNNRRQPRKETHLPAMGNFLQSKRSSRRGPACELWCLDDKGKACEIASTRR